MSASLFAKGKDQGFLHLEEIRAAFPNAEDIALHHQGGSTGYAGRDARVTDQTPGVVQPDQAFAWNPSITGTKVEDTVVAGDGGVEVLTADPQWPVDEETGLAGMLVR